MIIDYTQAICPYCQSILTRLHDQFYNYLACHYHNDYEICFSPEKKEISSYNFPIDNYYLCSNKSLNITFIRDHNNKIIIEFDFFSPLPNSLADAKDLLNRLLNLSFLA